MIARGHELGLEEFVGDVLPAIGVDAAGDDKRVRPHRMLDGVADGFAAVALEEVSRHLVEVGSCDSVGHERRRGARRSRSRRGCELIGSGKRDRVCCTSTRVGAQDRADRIVDLRPVECKVSSLPFRGERGNDLADVRANDFALVLEHDLEQLHKEKTRFRLRPPFLRMLAAEPSGRCSARVRNLLLELGDAL